MSEPQNETKTEPEQDMSAKIRTLRSNMKQRALTRNKTRGECQDKTTNKLDRSDRTLTPLTSAASAIILNKVLKYKIQNSILYFKYVF